MLKDAVKRVLTSQAGVRLLTGAEQFPPSRALLRRLNYPQVAFTNFADAWRAAGKDRHAGHDTDSIDMHREMMHTLRASDPRVLKILNEIATVGSLSVLDFGGNVGNIYYAYRPHLPQSLQLRWTVVDLPAVITAGQKLAAESNITELAFSDSLSQAAGPLDVLLASGSLHYWEGPIASFLEAVPGRPRHVIVNRSPVHPTRPTFVTVQQRPTFAVPCMVRNRDALIAEFAGCSYDLIDRWAAPELSMTFTLFPGLSVQSYSGFYFRKRS